jgi:hypothetical protein
MPISTIDSKGLTSPLTSGVTTNTVTSAAATALTLQSAGTTAITIDTSRNVTIAQAIKLSYSENNNYATDGALSNYASGNGVYLNGNAAGWLRLNGDGTNATYIQINGATYVNGSNTMQFINAGSERMRIESGGSVLINKTSRAADEGLGITGKVNSQCAILVSPISGDYDMINFRNANGQVGRIGCNGSATSYITSSDYRLKENITPMTGALNAVSALKPVTWKWKSTGGDGQGFLAHELAEVVPDCVTGDKDAVDADGNPVYQGVDTSFLVATLTKAIQELKTIVDAQAAEIAELKAKVA